MGVIKLLECDNCQQVTFKKDEPHFRVRGVNKAEGKVHKLVLCVKCARELFDAEPDAETADTDAPGASTETGEGAPATSGTPTPAKATAAPAKTAPAKQTAAKAS